MTGLQEITFLESTAIRSWNPPQFELAFSRATKPRPTHLDLEYRVVYFTQGACPRFGKVQNCLLNLNRL